MGLFSRRREIKKSISKQYHHESLGDITLVASYRTKRISISIRPSGEVRLTYPPGVSSERRAISYLDDKVQWVVLARKRVEARCRVTPDLPDGERLKYIEDLRIKAKDDLPQRTERLAQHIGLKYREVSIRVAKTRWGSCSGENNISLNIFLMELPEHLRDYVIIHELCHTVHHNHSPKFHALVDTILDGREKLLAKELKKYTIRR